MTDIDVRLRPIIEADLPNYVRWFNDPEVTQYLRREPGMTLEEEREWFARISAPDYTGINRAIEVDGRHVGGTGLHPHQDDFSADFGIVIGEKSCWGKGCGTAATREMLRIGFEERRLHRIQLQTWAHNLRAQRCYLKCRFRLEGAHRQAVLKGGQWLDALTMAILRDEWQTHPAGTADPEAAPDGVRVRGYRNDDHDQVAALWQAVGFHLRASDSSAALLRKAMRDPGLLLVAELDGRVVGTALGTWDGRRAFLNRVAVSPTHQRKGVGRRLLAEMKKRLIALGADRIGLLTGADHPEAIRFYESQGYAVSHDALYLRKDLAPPNG